MNLDTVIDQIKANAPIFSGNVAGAAEFAAARDQVWLPPPSAYVLPLEDDPTPNLKKTGLQQIVTEKIGIIVLLDNSMDRRGQSAATQAVQTVRAALFRAVLNWRPADTATGDVISTQGFIYSRGGLVGDPDRARLWWQFDFEIENTITDADGFQIPSTPLDRIEANMPGQTDGDPFAGFVAANLQS